MFGSIHARAALGVVLVLGCVLTRATLAQNPPSSSTPPSAIQNHNTSVHLRWGQQSGVTRYRLQLAHDRSFSDIIFDRVVAGNEIEINDLDAGRYFWRIAPLTTKLGEFSAVAVIEVSPRPIESRPSPTSSPINQTQANSILTGGGWRAALGDIGTAMTAHLRSAEALDLVAMNTNGAVFALDAATGVSLWNVHTTNQTGAPGKILLTIPGRSRLDNVVVLAGALALAIEGTTGRELWRSNLPAAVSSGALIPGPAGSSLVIVDNSRQRLFILGDSDGQLGAQLKLPARVVGAPVAMNNQGKALFALAYDNGDLEIRDAAGSLVRSANVGSAATTAPLFVRGPRENLLLLGTREGLTAMTADDLRPLGRMTIPNDTPRGTLIAQDLDGNGFAEVIMTTERRHLVVVNATDGKIVWDVPAQDYGVALAFADVNGDHILDVFVSGEQRLATALSGRDGSIIWKDDEPAPLATNHATAPDSNGLVAVSTRAGVLLVARDPSRTGLRAISFPGK